MVSKRSSVSDGMSQRRMGSKTDPVCSEEKVSVDMEKITPAQKIAGSQARSQTTPCGMGVRARSSANSGTGRGFLQGCSGKSDLSVCQWTPESTLGAKRENLDRGSDPPYSKWPIPSGNSAPRA